MGENADDPYKVMPSLAPRTMIEAEFHDDEVPSKSPHERGGIDPAVAQDVGEIPAVQRDSRSIPVDPTSGTRQEPEIAVRPLHGAR
jgi:hypothetical protein